MRQHIRDFGGAPGRVTLFGESAGAMSVGLHLFSAPGSKKLFRAAIMESNFLALPYKTLREQRNVGDLFKRSLNCANLVCLRRLDIHDLLLAQEAFTALMSTVFSGASFYLPFAPAIDGDILTRQPVLAAARAWAEKPLLIGTNKNEAVLFAEGQTITPAGYAAATASLFGQSFQRIINRYPVQADSSTPHNGMVWARAQTDDFLLCSSRQVAADVRSPAYVYLFDHQPSFPVWGGQACRTDDNVCHGAELPFVFHSAEQIGRHFTNAEARLSEQIMTYWTNFARELDPNGKSAAASGLSRWPAFRQRDKRYLVFSTPRLTLAAEPYQKVCKFWDGIGYTLVALWTTASRR